MKPNIRHKLNEKNRYHPLAHHESGAVLALSLSILLILTMVVTTSMSTTSQEENMAANSQKRNSTFQAAESAVEGTLTDILDGDINIIEEATNATTLYSGSSIVDIGSTDVVSTVQVRYLSELALAKGKSIDADESSAHLPGARFEIIGTGNMAAGSALTTVVRQGIEYQ